METSSPLHYSVIPFLTDHQYNTRSARGQGYFAYDVFCKENTEDAVSFIDSVMDPSAHGHTFCSDLTFFYWSKSVHWQKMMIENAEADMKRPKGGY